MPRDERLLWFFIFLVLFLSFFLFVIPCGRLRASVSFSPLAKYCVLCRMIRMTSLTTSCGLSELNSGTIRESIPDYITYMVYPHGNFRYSICFSFYQVLCGQDTEEWRVLGLIEHEKSWRLVSSDPLGEFTVDVPRGIEALMSLSAAQCVNLQCMIHV